MNIQAKLIVFMATMLLLVIVVTVGIGVWVINTIIYGLNTELLSLKLVARIEEIERVITILEDSGSTGIAKYVRQAQTEILQEFQEHIADQAEQYYIITGKDHQSLLQTKTGQDVNISADVLIGMIETQSGTTTFIENGITYFTVYQYFDAWDWLIGVSLPQVTMFQQRQVYLTTISFFSSIVFVGVFVLAYVIGKRSIVNPLAALVTVTKAIAAGNFDQTLQFRQRDEIGQLAEAIQMMAQQLRQNFEQIEAQLATIQRDMAERKRAEAALKESEERFRLFMDHLPGMAYIKDSTTHTLFANQGFMTYLNLAPAEILGKTNQDIFPPEFAEQITTEDLRVIESGQSQEIEESYGGRIWSTYKFTIPQPDRPPLLGGFTLDITERKQAEEALRESAERYRLIVSAAMDGFVEVEMGGHLLDVNEAYCRMIGYSRDELLEMSVPDIEAMEKPDEVKEHIQRMTKVGSELFETRHRRKDGRIIDVEVSMTFMRQTGHSLVFLRDITERKQVEVEREQLIAELESKNAELERFTYTVSHDLKSPLVTIQGFLGFLEQDAANSDPERFRKDIQRIREATETMQQLLNELLELSRIGRLLNPSQEMAFADLVQETLGRVAGAILERGVQVTVASPLPWVYGDRSRLVEVVQNLVDNAIKFMGNQPSPQIEIGVKQQGDETLFYVADNGIGIAPQYHEKIFGLFERLDSTIEGTGVGLALAKRIIEVHGGRIWVESEGQGNGSIFYFTVPQAPGGTP
jgi:PAS domain S-box-containing protein